MNEGIHCLSSLNFGISLKFWKKGEEFILIAFVPAGKTGEKMMPTPLLVLDLFMRVYKDKANLYTGECPALAIASCGASEQEARENIQESVTLFLEDCAEHGTLKQVLRKYNFTELHGNKRATLKKRERMQGLAIQNPPNYRRKSGMGSWYQPIPAT